MADLSRRAMLATSTAAVATALIPEAEATLFPNIGKDLAADIVKPAALADRDFWYLHMKTDERGRVGTDVSGSKFDPFCKPDEKFQAIRRRFVPLATEVRYRVCAGNWDEPDDDYPHGYFSLSDDERHAILRATIVERNEYDLDHPESYVELFKRLAQGDVTDETDYPLVDRATGMAAVAKLNRKTWDAIPIGETYSGMLWYALLEYAAPIASEFHGDTDICASGVGVETRYEVSPVRLVIPTAEELARFAIGGGN